MVNLCEKCIYYDKEKGICKKYLVYATHVCSDFKEYEPIR